LIASLLVATVHVDLNGTGFRQNCVRFPTRRSGLPHGRCPSGKKVGAVETCEESWIQTRDHLSYSYTPPCGSALLVTQDPSATLAVHCGNRFHAGFSPIKVLV